MVASGRKGEIFTDKQTKPSEIKYSVLEMRKQYFFDIELETGEKRTRDSVGAANKYIFTHSTRPINYSNKSTSHVLDKQTTEYGARQLIPYLHSE